MGSILGRWTPFFLAFCLLIAAPTLSGCASDGFFENAGEEADDAVDEVEDAAEDLEDEID